tara:strand:- start:8 stop:541 length:534 start_codon:yes stop_codon:yes gene_type:complete
MANTPFVSENFQRAYRNTFPGQTSTGRDLHVSDIIIPVVDFTPTTAGTSLPESLRFCRNLNTSVYLKSTSVTDEVVISGTGFFRVNTRLSNEVDEGGTYIGINDGSTTTIISRLISKVGTNTASTNFDDFVVFLRPQDSLVATMSLSATSNGAMTVVTTPLADVNGNLLSPNGFDPQ